MVSDIHVGFGVLMTNAYVCYTTEMTRAGVAKKKLLTHYEFRAKIARAWLDPDQHWPNHDAIVGVGSACKKRKRMDEQEAVASAARQTR